jgi:sortase A
VSVWMPSDWVRTVRDGQNGASTDPANPAAAPADSTPEHATTQNDAVQNGAIENGAIENGAIENGAIENGAIENGATPDGTAHGAPHDDAARDRAAAGGTGRNGVAAGGAVDGAPYDGAGRDGAAAGGMGRNGAAAGGKAPLGDAARDGGPDGAGRNGAGASGAAQGGGAARGVASNGGGADGAVEGAGAESDSDWAYRVADELRRQARVRGKERQAAAAAADDVSDLIAEPPLADAGASGEPDEPESADEPRTAVAEAPVLGPEDTWSAIVAQAEALAREPMLAEDEPSGTLFADPPRAAQMFRVGRRTPAEEDAATLFQARGRAEPAETKKAAPTAGDGIDEPTVVVPLPIDPVPDEGIDEPTVVLPLPDLRAALPQQADAPPAESTMDSAWPWFVREDEPATALTPLPPAAVNGTRPEPLPRRTPKAPPADTNARTPGGPSLFEPRNGLTGQTGSTGEQRPPFGSDPETTDERLLLQRPSTTLPPAADELPTGPPNDPPLRRRPRLTDPDHPVPDLDDLERGDDAAAGATRSDPDGAAADAGPTAADPTAADPAAADPAAADPTAADPADADPTGGDPTGVDEPTEVISTMSLAAALAGVDDPTEVVARPRFDEPPTEVIGPLGVGLWQEFTGDLSEDAERAIRNAGGTPVSTRITPDAVERARDRASRRAGHGAGGSGGGDDGNGPRGTRPKDNRPPPSRGDRVRTVVRGTGQTLITLGLVVLLFVAYELWVTNLFNARTQHKLGNTLAKEWEDGDDPLVGSEGGAPGPAKPGDKISRIPLGKGFANIYIPKFGLDYVYTVVEGTTPDDLNLGPGHYVGSALPGQVGNFAVAGHRVGKGSPFLNLDKLSAGDAIVIETKSFWYTYRVLPLTGGGPSNFAPTGVAKIPGMEIVAPTDVNVIRPVPGSTAKATQRLITLTTCHPKFSAKQRLIIHGVQDGAPWPKSKGDPPALKQG